MKKQLFILLIFGLSTLQLSAQETTQAKPESKKHSIGLSTGSSTGFGISYRYVPKRLGIQVTGFYWDAEDWLIANIAITPLFRLYEKKHFDLYLYQGNDFHQSSSYIINEKTIRTYDSAHSLGLGFEYKLFNKIGFNFMGGIAYYSDINFILPALEGAVYYKF